MKIILEHGALIVVAMVMMTGCWMIVPSESVIRAQGALHFIPPSEKTIPECKIDLIVDSSGEIYSSTDLLLRQLDPPHFAFQDSFRVTPLSTLYRIRIRCKGREDFLSDPFDSVMGDYFEVPLDLGLIRMDLPERVPGQNSVPGE